MYLQKLKISNFRKYGINGRTFDTALPGIEVQFNKGLNVLIGENDSGKTSIIDAIKVVLHTQSGEYIRIEDKDFHQNEGVRAKEMKIECVFDGFTPDDAALFLEWLEITADGSYRLTLRLYAKVMDSGAIYQTVKAVINNEGSILDYEAGEKLRAVYLKPLRDALTDMTHGKKSRFAQILLAHPLFSEKSDGKNKLIEKYKKLKDEVNIFFNQPGEDNIGNLIIEKLNSDLLSKFLTAGDNRSAVINLTGSEINDIMRQLDLILEENKSGLGSLNLLCIAAELLLLREKTRGLSLTMIEEMEAHLHPQYQLRLIDFIRNFGENHQFILTTHSITMGSVIPLEHLTIVKGNKIFPMGHEFTELQSSDYLFLERFLDATKANLFFAKGLIIVEGDAENLLLPQIAKLIERPLHEYGVSIVNVGSTAFKRYAKIFKRKDGKSFEMPVAIVSDLDVRSIEYYEDKKDDENEDKNCKKIVICDDAFKRECETTEKGDFDFNDLYDGKVFSTQTEFLQYVESKHPPRRYKNKWIEVYKRNLKIITQEAICQIRSVRKAKIESENTYDNVSIYLPDNWTFEYEFAKSTLYKELEIAIRLAFREKENANFVFSIDMIKELRLQVDEELNTKTFDDKLSYEIFKPLNDGTVSKAMTAQYLGAVLEDKVKTEKKLGVSQTLEAIKTDPNLQYIIKSIEKVTKPLI